MTTMKERDPVRVVLAAARASYGPVPFPEIIEAAARQVGRGRGVWPRSTRDPAHPAARLAFAQETLRHAADFGRRCGMTRSHPDTEADRVGTGVAL